MMPEAKARQAIDALLVASGWYVCNVANGMWARIVGAIGRRPSIVREVEVDTNLDRAQATLATEFYAEAKQV
jgi:hypothetical protein